MTETRGQLPKRKTIAVLGAQLSRVWGGEFMAGVLNAARANDVNVVFFMGGKPAAIGDPLALDR